MGLIFTDIRWKTSGKGRNAPFDEGKTDEGSPDMPNESRIKKFTHKTKLPNRKGWEKGKGSFFLNSEGGSKYKVKHRDLRDVRKDLRKRESEREKSKDDAVPVINKEYIRDYKTRHKKYREKIKKDLDMHGRRRTVPHLLKNSTII